MHEEEELQHDISKLQDQVQQILLSQIETKQDLDGLKGNMDGLKLEIKGEMNGLKANTEAMMNAKMEGLKKLLQ